MVGMSVQRATSFTQVPVSGLQLSTVHLISSSQFGGGPWTQAPPEQKSSVHRLSSSQLGRWPGMQLPFKQTSGVVQGLPSLQVLVLLAWVHPVAGLQPSSVQTLPSLQFGAGPPTHEPPEHASPVVHAFPSEHGLLLSAWVHPEAGLQPSSVQMFASSQLSEARPTQVPLAQTSPLVQALPSSHGLELFTKTQPLAGSQLSVVQILPSLHLMSGPPLHDPPEQASPMVQAFPSLHGFVLLEWTQPIAGLHESSVQMLPSLQLRAEPPTQAPLAQVSCVVQGFPSLQGLELFE